MSQVHLHRYVGEFAFRYNNRVALNINNSECAGRALKAISGKRLTCRRLTAHSLANEARDRTKER